MTDVYREEIESALRVTISALSGRRPNENAMKIILAVIESTAQTDREWNEIRLPPTWKYAVDVRSFLRDILVTLEDYQP